MHFPGTLAATTSTYIPRTLTLTTNTYILGTQTATTITWQFLVFRATRKVHIISLLSGSVIGPGLTASSTVNYHWIVLLMQKKQS